MGACIWYVGVNKESGFWQNVDQMQDPVRSIKCQRVGSAFFMFFSLLKRKLKDGGKKRSRMMAGGRERLVKAFDNWITGDSSGGRCLQVETGASLRLNLFRNDRRKFNFLLFPFYIPLGTWQCRSVVAVSGSIQEQMSVSFFFVRLSSSDKSHLMSFESQSSCQIFGSLIDLLVYTWGRCQFE
ncbi:hypothetical protein EYC84_002691 [Monilinia fructicola]|uniref:Uncharacterized protein n=1 Tax=Monilinia fructicola TaxID=38448 RepID=A0A5M9JRI9_MONFR|nr:hypothetical protein EYC84_002691 [Monilinia fructicola]